VKKNNFYLSDEANLQQAMDVTGLALDEIEQIVGRFAKHSCRAGQLRGEVVVHFDRVQIRHHFTKQVLWECEQQ
jgi:hypothetical protein